MPACGHTFEHGKDVDVCFWQSAHYARCFSRPQRMRFYRSSKRVSKYRQDSPMVVEALLLDLMSRHLDVLRERSVARPKWLITLLDYLDDTFEQEWTLANMAAEVGVHPVYLCRVFSEHFDCTLGEYIRRLRVLRGR